MLDLYGASRDELIRLILAQREALADQARRIAGLEAEAASQRATIAHLTARLGEVLAAAAPSGDGPADGADGPGAPRGMPGLKPAEAAGGERPPRRRRGRGFARRRMAPTARQVHALAACPACGAPLAGGTPKRTREVIEVPPAAAVVTEHVYLERRCPDCGRRCVSPPELDGVVVGQSRLGSGLVSLIAVLREEARLPYATIQALLRALHGLELSVGALVGAVQRVAARGQPAATQAQAAIRASPVVHADETGWRQDGHNGYVWTLSTPTHRYFVRGTREKAMLAAALGADFAGVLVSDFYVAYTSYEGRHQYCWAHLLRDVHDLVERHPRDASVHGWAEALGTLFAQAQARARASADPAARRRAAQTCQAEVAALCAPYLLAAGPAAGPVPPQRGLCQRIERHLADLFVFVEEPAVPPTNNAAERSLRHLVVSRKISGGTRSAAGSATKTTLATLFGTWRVQGLNPFTECRRLLTNPQG
jgi:hypothetical protein